MPEESPSTPEPGAEPTTEPEPKLGVWGAAAGVVLVGAMLPIIATIGFVALVGAGTYKLGSRMLSVGRAIGRRAPILRRPFEHYMAAMESGSMSVNKGAAIACAAVVGLPLVAAVAAGAALGSVTAGGLTLAVTIVLTTSPFLAGTIDSIRASEERIRLAKEAAPPGDGPDVVADLDGAPAPAVAAPTLSTVAVPGVLNRIAPRVPSAPAPAIGQATVTAPGTKSESPAQTGPPTYPAPPVGAQGPGQTVD